MNVHLTLHGILRDYLPRTAKGKTTLSLPDGATVEDVLKSLKINRIVNGSVNGVQVEPDRVLKDGDELQLFRPISGG